MGRAAPHEAPARRFGWRHVQVLGMFLMGCSAITLRVCLSVAVVDMTAADNGDGQQRFDWAPTEKSAVLGSFLWGYMSTQVLGGALSSQGGATLILGSALGLSGLLTALLPLVATIGGWAAVTGLRAVTGIVQGCMYPTTYTLLGRWIPPAERSRSGALILASQPMGNVLSMALSGLMAYAWGWPSVFYIFGGVSMVSAVVVYVVLADRPEAHPRISEEERDYVIQSINAGAMHRARIPVPWVAMLTSVPLWALFASHLGWMWGYWVLLTCLPSYINNLLDVGIEWNGLLSAAPQLAMMILSLVFGWMGDTIQSRHLMSITATRRLFNTIGMFGPGALCILAAWLGPSNPPLAVSLLTVMGGLCSACFTGAIINYVDIAPNFGGVTFAIANMLGSFVSAFAPYAEGLLVDRKDPMPGWSNVFYLTAALYIATNVVWCIWGTAEVQPWNNPASSKSDCFEESTPSTRRNSGSAGIRNEAFHSDK
ncbi:putative inorganic phosphate cotransporter [Thrips palmi]|uniref:Inorganic phosphate cotransporter n=1 Tax=Thrips palmi TaxID=161013 RepID=A0A6P8Z987_THRPL|nr:putative inorganic phosphate cotransporter [Thrips palmi]